MVWGINYLQEPPEEFWPANSFIKDHLVHTKLLATGEKFAIGLNLPNSTLLNYWMVQTKDKNGKETESWDSGSDNQPYFTINYQEGIIYYPGLFIFLAGFLPLLLFYYKNRGRQTTVSNVAPLQIKDYIPQFDSIRAIAVLLVIIYHWVPARSLLNFLPNGPLGVNIFFVLSGFLITGILLKAKRQVEEQGLKKASVFKNFYIRRTLRIFPIYYLLLFILWFLNDPAIKEDGIYYFTYTSNYLFYSEQFFPDRLAHLWSLGVEEQFYILWPWLMILVNKKFLPYLIFLFVIIGISSNYIFVDKDWWVTIFTPACFDAFAIGGFLAYLTLYRQDIIEGLQKKVKWIFLFVLILFALDIYGISFLPARTIHALLAALLIYYCLFKNNIGIANSILNNKWLIRMGKISYGIYLYHLLVPELWAFINKKFESAGIDFLFNKAMPGNIRPAWMFTQKFIFLIIIAALSWRFIEKPINNLKDRFTIRPKPVII